MKLAEKTGTRGDNQNDAAERKWLGDSYQWNRAETLPEAFGSSVDAIPCVAMSPGLTERGSGNVVTTGPTRSR